MTSPRRIALPSAVLVVAALTACAPPTPQHTEPSAAEPATPSTTSGAPTTEPPEASTPHPTPELALALEERSIWQGMTSHCTNVGRLMQVDGHTQPLVNGYAPVDLHDSGPREAARGDVETLSDGSPFVSVVAEGDQVIALGRRFCAPDPDYLAWLYHVDDADSMTLRPGMPISLVPFESSGQDLPVPTESLGSMRP